MVNIVVYYYYYWRDVVIPSSAWHETCSILDMRVAVVHEMNAWTNFFTASDGIKLSG